MPRVPSKAPANLPDLGAYRQWSPDAQARALELLREHEETAWRPFFCPILDCNGHPHGSWEWEHARVDQRPPPWTAEWLLLLLLGGRGGGKTRTGAEVTHRASAHVPRMALIAPTGPDLRDTMVEGLSGILATSPPGKRPLWEPSKKKLTWPNGCIGQGFSAEEPDRLRGPAHEFAWLDEPCFYPAPIDAWDNLMFGMRVGNPKVVATTTPKPITWLKDRIAEGGTVLHRASTYDNLANLAPVFARRVLAKYEGTRLGRQELHGEILEDVDGALWSWDWLHWVDEAPDLVRIVVGVDPAGSAHAKSDETGIVTVGIGADKNLYVLDDSSGRYSPALWAARANGVYEDFAADAIVPEKNYGGDMVKHTLESSGYRGARIIPVTSRRGKVIRAEPVAALYERGRVFHVGKQGDLTDLENELTQWVPGNESPNRLDALVHAATELAKQSMPAEIANPRDLHRRYLRAV